MKRMSIDSFSVNFLSSTMALTVGVCDVCSSSAVVLEIDSSNGEYGPGCICQACILLVFAQWGIEEERTDDRDDA